MSDSLPLERIRGGQSPINVDLKNCKYDPALKPIQFMNDPADCAEVVNNGKTWSIVVKPQPQTRLRANHLPGVYRLSEIHGHWSDGPNNGSEHRINNSAFAAEIHIVHEKESYGQLELAKMPADGITVVGILLQETSENNPSFDPLIQGLKEVTTKGKRAPLHRGWDLAKLIPSNGDFCTYSGSLTTPPYPECALWTVFVNPVSISSNQMQAFRSLSVNDKDLNAGGVAIGKNNRDCQPLGNREVLTSFKYAPGS